MTARPTDGDAAAEPDEPPPPVVLEFALDPPSAAARLSRHPALAAARASAGGRLRTVAEELIWLDTPDGDLADDGMVLEAPRRGARHLLRTLPPPKGPWLPGTTPEPEDADGIDAEDAPLVPFAAFSGRRGALPLAPPAPPGTGGPLDLVLLTGKLRAVAAERPVARLRLSGPAEPMLDLARRLAADLPLLPAAAALAEEARALARGEAVPRPRRRGPPDLGRAATVEAALLTAIGHLLEIMLHQAPLCRMEVGPEGVHQMRVALRRLRSVLKAFRSAIGRCPEVAAFDAGLGALAKRLGEARDLDVFLGGIGARVVAAMPGDPRIAALMAALEARREAAYRSLREALEAPAFRLLVLDGLALLLRRPWRGSAPSAPPDEQEDRPPPIDEALPGFAARLLDKRWHRLCTRGEAIESLGAEALHDLRLEAKRLRYAAELFAPLWSGKATRRFLKRLAELQEALGTTNDATVARGLVAGLGEAVPAWAVGAVEGFAVAAVGEARHSALSAWEDLMDTTPFWSNA
jgi:CHAD domain-containing protein